MLALGQMHPTLMHSNQSPKTGKHSLPQKEHELLPALPCLSSMHSLSFHKVSSFLPIKRNQSILKRK